MKLLIEESVVRQALEALCDVPDSSLSLTRALRDAVENQPKRSPSLWINGTTKDCTFNPHTADNWLKQGHAVRPYYKD